MKHLVFWVLAFGSVPVGQQLRLPDEARPRLLNLRVDVRPTHAGRGLLVGAGDWLAFNQSELWNGDLDGDGDATNPNLSLYNARTGAITNTGLSVGRLLLDEAVGAFFVTEAEEGTDLNLDGDLEDSIVFAFDAATGSWTDLQISADLLRVGTVLEGDRLAFGVYEGQGGHPPSGEGLVDLNDDGDLVDTVLHVYKFSNDSLFNTELATLDQAVITGDRLLFTLSEGHQGKLDWNGDLDALDDVVYSYDLFGRLPTNLSFDARPFSRALHLVGERAFIFASEQGGTSSAVDLNGDGDTDDLHVLFEVESGGTTNHGLATDSLIYPADAVSDDEAVYFLVHEGSQGADLDGDGLQISYLLFRAQGGLPPEDLGVRYGLFDPLGPLVSGRLHIPVSELLSGFGDLNGDGDEADSVSHLFDPSTGTLQNLGLALQRSLGTHPDAVVLDDRWAVLAVPEADQGGVDLDGNGVVGGNVCHVVDLQSGAIHNLRLEIDADRPPLIAEKGVLLFAEERVQDWNGDGDTDDHVAHWFDTRRGIASNLKLASSASIDPQVVGDGAAFVVGEALQGLADLNGDGDAGDLVLFVVDP